MGGFFDRFLRWLQSDSKSAPRTHGNPDLHPIDTNRLAKELDLEREAERLGKKELPQSSDKSPIGTEFRVIQVIEKARQDYADWGAQRVRLLNEIITSTDVTPLTRLALQQDAEFERRAGALLNEWSTPLKQLIDDVREKTQGYEHYRKAQDLTQRPAQIPTDWERRLRHTGLFALVLLEAGLNSVFFAQGMWGGLLDGIFYALFFAALNIALAYCYGRFFLPQVFHRSPVRKAIGIVLLAVSVAAIVAVALLIAHYRDAVSGGAYENAARTAWETFRSTPTTLQDVHSAMLCAISIVFALVAVYDAFGLDDPYPGYGRMARRRNQAIADHAIELGAIREQLEIMKAESLAGLDQFIDKAEIQLNQLDQAIAQKAETDTKLANAFTNVDNCLEALLNMFRQHNRMHRSTPAPDYFTWPVTQRPIVRPDCTTSADKVKYQVQKVALDDLNQGLPRIRANIQRAYSRLYDGLTSLDEHFPTVNLQIR